MQATTLCTLNILSTTALDPKVREEDGTHINTGGATRIARQPEIQQTVSIQHSPPAFNFRTTIQQDPQKLRYYRQQQIDASNFLRNFALSARQLIPKQNPTVSSQVNSSKASTTEDSKQRLPGNANSREFGAKLPSTRLPITQYIRNSKKLNSYQVEESEDLQVQGTEAVKRKDILANLRPIYINPEVFKRIASDARREPETDLKALNELIGKNPTTQLEGLKQLLTENNELPLQPTVKIPQPFQPSPSHKPIVEPSSEDVETQNEYVVKQPDSGALARLQAQLDASSQAHVQNALEQARKQAQAIVEQQHRAIAIAQEKARNAAMEKIRAHNAGIFGEQKKQVASSKEDTSPQATESRISPYPQHQLYYVPQALQASQEIYNSDDQEHQQHAYVQEEAAHLIAEQHSPHVKVHKIPVEIQATVEPTVESYHELVVKKPVLHHQDLQKLTEESIKAYGGDQEEVSKSKCKRYVSEKLAMFKQQFCKHLFRKYGSRNQSSDEIENFVLELNCVKMETAKNFFSNKLKEMYKSNRKAFFSLCYFNESSANIKLNDEFYFANNLTHFNERFIRQKRDISEVPSENQTNSDYADYYYYYDDDYEYTDYKYDNSDNKSVGNTENQYNVNDTVQKLNQSDIEGDYGEPLGAAESLVSRRYLPKYKRKPVHNHNSYKYYNHAPVYKPITIPPKKTPFYYKDHKSELLPAKMTEKEPTNVIVINNSNDNHNHGSNVNLYNNADIPKYVKRPIKIRKKPKRPLLVAHRKPNAKKIIHLSKKIENVLSKLG